MPLTNILTNGNAPVNFAPGNLNTVLGGNTGTFVQPSVLQPAGVTGVTVQPSVVQPAGSTGIFVQPSTSQPQTGGSNVPATVTTSNGDGTTTTTTTTGTGSGTPVTATNGTTTTSTADTPIYKKWWFYALIVGGLAGGYFLIKKVGK